MKSCSGLMRSRIVKLIMFGMLMAGGNPALASLYTFTTIDAPNATLGTYANGINNSGQIAGSYINATGNHAFIDNGGVFTTIDHPDASSLLNGGTAAIGINDSGQIVGTYIDALFVNHGFLYSAGVFTTIDDSNGTFGTIPSGINASGQIVGSYFDATGNHGFLYDSGVFTTIDAPDAAGFNGTQLTGINASGQIVGVYVDALYNVHSFLYYAGAFTALDNASTPPSFVVTGIDDSGQLVGTYSQGVNDVHGFLYNAGVLTTIDVPSGTLGTFPNGINSNGTGLIVGAYYDVLGNPSPPRGFLGTPVPEPTTLPILAGCLLAFTMAFRRKFASANQK